MEEHRGEASSPYVKRGRFANRCTKVGGSTPPWSASICMLIVLQVARLNPLPSPATVSLDLETKPVTAPNAHKPAYYKIDKCLFTAAYDDKNQSQVASESNVDASKGNDFQRLQ